MSSAHGATTSLSHSVRQAYHRSASDGSLAAFTFAALVSFAAGYATGRWESPAIVERRIHEAVDQAERRMRVQLAKHRSDTHEAIRDHASDTSERLLRYGSDQSRRLQKQPSPQRQQLGRQPRRSLPSEDNSSGLLSDRSDGRSGGSFHLPDPIIGSDRYDYGSVDDLEFEDAPRSGCSSNMRPADIDRGVAANAAASSKDYGTRNGGGSGGGISSRPWIDSGNPNWSKGGSYDSGGDRSDSRRSSSSSSRFRPSRENPGRDGRGSGESDGDRHSKEHAGFGPLCSYRSSGKQNGGGAGGRSGQDENRFRKDSGGGSRDGGSSNVRGFGQASDGGSGGGRSDKSASGRDDGGIRDFRSDTFRDIGDISGQDAPAGCPALRDDWH